MFLRLFIGFVLCLFVFVVSCSSIVVCLLFVGCWLLVVDC